MTTRLHEIPGLGPRLDYDAILELLTAWPTPALLKHAGKARIDAKLKKHGARRHTAWATAIMDALEEQGVIVVGTDAAGLVIPHMARQLISLHAQRVDCLADVFGSARARIR